VSDVYAFGMTLGKFEGIDLSSLISSSHGIPTHCRPLSADGTPNSGKDRPHDASAITPMGFEHININGVLIFPLDHFRNRLMPLNTPSVRPASAPG
jgi:hypothetical protein